jgi:predicted HicB family RNase H-like nuclease
MNFEFREGNPAGTAVTTASQGAAQGAAEKVKSAAASKRAEDLGAKFAAELAVFRQVADELRSRWKPSASLEERCHQVLHCATELFGLAPTWSAFYREVLGVEGAARSLFADAAEMCAYEESDAHSKVLEMLTALRSRDLPDCDPNEAQRMITVRIPSSLHDSICKEANDLQVSVNKLCITRLVQRVDRELVPSSAQKRRGRRPGAEYSKSSTPSVVFATAAGQHVPSEQRSQPE